MARKPRTILEVCVAELGVHRGAVAAANVAQWAIATHDLGHVPSGSEYAEWWNVTDRTSWNHCARIRAVFGDDWRLVVRAVADHVGELRSPRAVMGLPLPVAV